MPVVIKASDGDTRDRGASVCFESDAWDTGGAVTACCAAAFEARHSSKTTCPAMMSLVFIPLIKPAMATSQR